MNGKSGHTQNQYIKVQYPYYIPENIYTILKYEKSGDKNDVVYTMCELWPGNLIDELLVHITAKKIIKGQRYFLKSGIIVLDVKSYIAGGAAPLTVSSKYVSKPVLGGRKILFEQEIVDAEKIND